MAQQFSENIPRPQNDLPPNDRHLELLREVLSATSEARRSRSGTDQARFRQVALRWRDAPWAHETIGVALVRAALHDWLATVQLSHLAEDQLTLEIANALFDDPSSAARMKQWWKDLQEHRE